MTAGTLPVEIFTRIVQHFRASELPPLCRVNKTFQRVAERRLYNSLVLGDIKTAYQACLALLANDGARGAYVKRFWFFIDPRRSTLRGPLPPPFWQTLQSALSTMIELKDLLINDPVGANTFILDPDDIKFQLHSAKFHLVWDEYMVAFLQSQSQLKHLQTLDAADLNQVCALPAGHLPALEAFEGPLLVAAEVLACPRLSYLRTTLDDEVVHLLPQFVESITCNSPPLCSFHVNLIPESVLSDTLEAITFDPKLCARLRHLGILSMPWVDVRILHGPRFFRTFMC